MKRLTALALAGVLLLGTACGGGNQANDAATQAGAATTQDQTADGAEEAAAEPAEAEEGTADPAASGDTEKTADEKTESTSGSRPKSDAKGGKGDVTAFVFDKMEEAEWTGTIHHKDGSEEEITVPLIEDTETGKTVLGDAKRKILCADFADYEFNKTLTPRASEDGTTWNEDELMIYYNFIRVWDYYKEIGWTG